jgi:hypothetical protein
MRRPNTASVTASKIYGRDNSCIELVCLALTLALLFLASRIGSLW